MAGSIVPVPHLLATEPARHTRCEWRLAGFRPILASMDDYQPVDLTALCNAGVQTMAAVAADPPVGAQRFQGLPFEVGGRNPRGDRCFVHFASGTGSLAIPIGRPCYTVIVAHLLLQSDLPSGGPLGRPVATYRFRATAGAAGFAAAIRERFEIGVHGGDRAFAAVDEHGESMLPRYEGRWEDAGLRQKEAIRPKPTYHLWTWRNPDPEVVIEDLLVEPVAGGPAFLIAAVTSGHVDEHPFARQGRRPVRVTLTEPQAASKPFSVEVSVDRGIATYAHPLPRATSEEFIADPYRGWGEPQNPDSSPLYSEIAATGSATLTVDQGGLPVGRVRWREVQRQKSVQSDGVRVELLDGGRNWVHVTVLDDDTGKQVPCRVHFRSPEGVPFQPHGHHNQVNSNNGSWHLDVGGDVRLGQITYAYIDGRCQGWLPRGEVLVDVARGFEYEPLRSRVQIKPGQRDLTLRIKRWSHMNEKGWYSGDSHVHFLSAQGSHTESQGADLNVVNLLQSQWGSLFTNTEEFTGGASVMQQGDNIVYVSQENRQHFLGHLILWGLKEPVMPWGSDGASEAEPGGSLDVTMSDWADQTHAQGGHVIVPHLPNPNGEPAALIATGRADGVEMLRQTEFNHLEYYRYLNCGYRLPLVGGTDKMSSDVPVGIYRTYAHVGEDRPFTYESWCEAVRTGRTFLSGGPLIGLTVDGASIGETLQLSGAGTVEVHAWAESILPIHTLQIVQQGRVVAQVDASGEGATTGRRRLELRERLTVDGHSWLAARVGGPGYGKVAHHDGWQRGIFAHTSPIYVAVGGDWALFDRAAAEYMLTLIDGCVTYIRDTAPLRPDAETTFHHGEPDHHAYLERPFHEAREAIHRRMHAFGIPH
jgi:hypothetical protein